MMRRGFFILRTKLTWRGLETQLVRIIHLLGSLAFLSEVISLERGRTVKKNTHRELGMLLHGVY